LKEHGENRLEEAMQRVGQIFAANIRQNDLAFRYEINSIALILGETAEREAGLALEKLRKVCAELTIGDGEAFVFSAGIAEAVVRQQFDSADVVTEVINRAELALDMALAQGPGKFVPVAAQFASAAVA
jgi:GGDEF domain-containing protein